MSENKWDGFKSPNYNIVDLGRPKTFLIPVNKLDIHLPSGKTVRDDLHEFLLTNFGAFTTTYIPGFGIWRNNKGQTYVDACTKYEVSFVGKERIPLVLTKLAELARAMNEECLYVSAGQYNALVEPSL